MTRGPSRQSGVGHGYLLVKQPNSHAIDGGEDIMLMHTAGNF